MWGDRENIIMYNYYLVLNIQEKDKVKGPKRLVESEQYRRLNQSYPNNKQSSELFNHSLTHNSTANKISLIPLSPVKSFNRKEFQKQGNW